MEAVFVLLNVCNYLPHYMASPLEQCSL